MSFFQNMMMTSLTSLNKTNEITSWENKLYLPKWPNQESPKQADDGRTSVKKKKRTRTSFTTEQRQYLEDAFSKHHYCCPSDRHKIADDLKLGEKQIKLWFQNRRMKSKNKDTESTLNSSGMSRSTSIPVSRKSSSSEDVLHSPEKDYTPNQYELSDAYLTPVQQENAFSNNYNQEYCHLYHSPLSNYGTNTNFFPTEYYPGYSEVYTPSYTYTAPENSGTHTAMASNVNWQDSDYFSNI